MKGWLGDLFRYELYKRSQGRVTRQVTFAVVAVTVLLGAWRLGQRLMDYGPSGQYGVPLVVAVIGIWIAYRLVNMPRFADFLISVEAEMNKVSWPTREVLFRSAAVVMFTIFAMAAMLYLYDIVWRTLMALLKVAG